MDNQEYGGLDPELYRLWTAEAANPTRAQQAWRKNLTPEERELVRKLDREAAPLRNKPILSERCTLEKPPGTMRREMKAQMQAARTAEPDPVWWS